jgi:hypothetical protein
MEKLLFHQTPPLIFKRHGKRPGIDQHWCLKMAGGVISAGWRYALGAATCCFWTGMMAVPRIGLGRREAQRIES